MIPLVKGKIKRFLTFFGTRHLGSEKCTKSVFLIAQNRLFRIIFVIRGKVYRFGFSFVLSGLDLGVDFCFFRDFREFWI